jgi:hypothetical protein
MMSIAADLTGKRFGRWSVLSRSQSLSGVVHWLCQCDCGTKRNVAGSKLRCGKTQSCGCFRADWSRENNVTHGHRRNGGSSEYQSWKSMKERCRNPRDRYYKDYGGRGIFVCQEWLGKSGFQKFLEDMGPKPSRSHTIDRREVNGPYSAKNCRWATPGEQQRNKRINIFVRVGGKKMCLTEACLDLGLSYSGVYARMVRKKLSPEEAILRDRRYKNIRPDRLIEAADKPL